jgi:hypothetical protein
MPTISLSIISALIAGTLVFSFGLHSVQVAHEHPDHVHTFGATHETEEHFVLALGEYMHMAEKKLYLTVPPVVQLAASVSLILFGSWALFVFLNELSFVRFLRKRKEMFSAATDHIRITLSRGIMHPKLH